jgi:predicted acylesterase/phospholipase RssA
LAAIGFFLWRRWLQRGAGQAALQCRIAGRDELRALHAYSVSKFGSQVSDVETMAAWYDRNHRIFQILTTAAGVQTAAQIRGYYCVLPLNDEGRRGVAQGLYFGASIPDHVLVGSSADASALYVGGVAGDSPRDRVAIMLALQSHLKQFPNAAIVYTRPVTRDGLRLVSRGGFRRVDGGEDPSPHVLYFTDAATPGVREKASPQPAGKKGKDKKTVFFGTAYGVFQGGGCRAAAYAGAYSEAVSRGVRFVEVAGTSAGAVAAALIGAGTTPMQLRRILSELDFGQLLLPLAFLPKRIRRPVRRLLLKLSIVPRLPRFLLLKLGAYSGEQIEAWLEGELKKLLPSVAPNDRVKFKDLPIPVTVVAADLEESKIEIWNEETDEVSKAVRASCSIPFFFEPVERRFVDGGALSNLPSWVFRKQNQLKRPDLPILAFTLRDERPKGRRFRTVIGLLSSLITTVVDGSQALQMDLLDNVHVITVPTGDVKATDFGRMTPEIVAQLMNNGQSATRAFFRNELTNVNPGSWPRILCANEEEVFTLAANMINSAREKVMIALDDLSWVEKLYLALVCARARGVGISVLMEREREKDREWQRQLIVLGITPQVGGHGMQVFLADWGLPSAAALVLSEDDRDRGVAYSRTDAVVVRMLARACVSDLEAVRESQSPLPVNQCGEASLAEALRRVPQYRDSDICIREVPVSGLVGLSRYVQECAYRQIQSLARIHEERRWPLFSPAVAGTGAHSLLLLPIVVEHSPDSQQYLIVAGLARAAYCHHHGIENAVCAVVDGVGQPPFSAGRFELPYVRVVCSPKSREERYKDYNEQNQRVLPRTLP